MDLPNDEVGITDILDYRECPQRFAFGMRRHVELPVRFQTYPGEKEDPPGSTTYANAYGSATHDAIAVVEKTQCSDEEAITAVWPVYQGWLEPDDHDRMMADLATYRTRTTMGFRLVAAEKEMRVPLFVYKGRQIYFRFRIDALYQSIENPGLYMTRDYKTGRWRKSDAEIHKDLQQWAYNFGAHEVYPEIETLVQQYDQLRYGMTPTRKTAHQRAQIKQWLIRQVTAILEDEHLKPKQNDFCQFCPLMMDCRVTHLSPDHWINRLGALAPEKKEGRKIVVQLTEDQMGYEAYTELLPKVKKAKGVMERFIAAVETTLKEMPQDRREEHGYRLGRPRSLSEFDADALRTVHERVGDDVWHLVTITKKAVEDFYGDDPVGREILSLATPKQGAPSLMRETND